MDLTDVPADRQRYRIGAVQVAPSGCRVVLVVGALRVEPSSVWMLKEHLDRLDVDVRGEPHAVQRWLEALRSEDGFLLGGAA